MTYLTKKTAKWPYVLFPINFLTGPGYYLFYRVEVRYIKYQYPKGEPPSSETLDLRTQINFISESEITSLAEHKILSSDFEIASKITKGR